MFALSGGKHRAILSCCLRYTTISAPKILIKFSGITSAQLKTKQKLCADQQNVENKTSAHQHVLVAR